VTALLIVVIALFGANVYLLYYNMTWARRNLDDAKDNERYAIANVENAKENLQALDLLKDAASKPKRDIRP
jgi:hypothetical protein